MHRAILIAAAVRDLSIAEELTTCVAMFHVGLELLHLCQVRWLTQLMPSAPVPSSFIVHDSSAIIRLLAFVSICVKSFTNFVDIQCFVHILPSLPISGNDVSCQCTAGSSTHLPAVYLYRYISYHILYFIFSAHTIQSAMYSLTWCSITCFVDDSTYILIKP